MIFIQTNYSEGKSILFIIKNSFLFCRNFFLFFLRFPLLCFMRYFKNKKSLIEFLSQESTRTHRAHARIIVCERSEQTIIFFSFLFLSFRFVMSCFVILCLLLSCIVLSCKAENFKQYVYIIFHKFQINYSSHCIEYSPAIIDSHILRCLF